MLTKTDVQAKLARKGLKSTTQRLVIYQAVAASAVHPSAEDVFAAISQEYPTISLGTVYKTLELLVEHELLCRVPVAEGCMRYDACTADHGHIFCSNTGEIVDFHDPQLEQMIQQYLEKKGIGNFNLRRISLHLQGNKIDPEQSINL